MRNLKKILALVLALVMSLSLMATAGAADTTASGETITPAYQTAIDVLKGVEVFRGYEDGTIRPQNTITRAEVAAILYRIATGDVNDAKVSIYTDMANVNFTDLANANWAKGYINYCANAQLIVGMGDGTFKPQQNITGYATLAMVLRALGYDKNGEFKGSGWEIRTAAQARELGILKNVTSDLGSYATRELVSELLFRAILCETVTYSPLNQNLYQKTGKTLAKENLGLEEIEGVVVANEWANLYGSDVLGADTTELEVAENEIRTLKEGTELQDVGMSKLVYTQTDARNTYKVIKIADSGKNNVKENDGAALKTNTAANFSKAAGMPAATDIEYYVNFDRTGKYTSDYRLEFSVSFNHTATQTALEVKAAFEKDYVNGLELTSKEVGMKNVGTTANPYIYSKIIRADDDISNEDLAVIKGIFAAADLETYSTIYEGIDGYVYVGTKSNPNSPDASNDVSDTMSYRAFVKEYINVETYDVNWDSAENGEWVKFIDNDDDGYVDYAFKTEFTLDEIVSSYKKGDETKYVFNKLNENIVSFDWLYDNMAVGDVVLTFTIDGVAHINLAEYDTDTVKTVNYKDVSITLDNGTTRYQSGIYNDTKMPDDITDVNEKTEYNLYRDYFEYVRAYEETAGTQYALVTEAYFTNQNASAFLQNWPVTAEVAIGETSKTAVAAQEYNLVGGASNPFVSEEPWSTVNNRRVNNVVADNYLQPATSGLAHLQANNALVGPTLLNDDTYTYWKWNNGTMSQYVYEWKTVGSAFDYGTQYLGGEKLADNSTSFTNVARYTLNGDDITLVPADRSRDSSDYYNVDYTIDYIQLSTDEVAKGDRQYKIHDHNYVGEDGKTYNYRVENNNHVSAVHDTQYYIVSEDGIYYFTDYTNVPAITKEITKGIHAAYAVARNVNADKDEAPYWVADVIVYEVKNWDPANLTSIALAYFLNSKTTGEIQSISALDNKTENPDVTIVPDNRYWTSGHKQGFYKVFDQELDGTTLTASRIDPITKNYNANKIYASIADRVFDVNGRGDYIEVENSEYAVTVPKNISLDDITVCYSISKDSKTANVLTVFDDYLSAGRKSDIQKGDALIWVMNDTKTAFVVNLGPAEYWYSTDPDVKEVNAANTPVWLYELWVDIMNEEQNAPADPTAWAVEVNTNGNGTASANVAKAEAGDVVTITATPAAGYAVDKVIVNGIDNTSDVELVANTDGTYSFTMGKANAKVYVTFKATGETATKYAITVETPVNGTASAPAEAAEGETVTVTYAAAEGYTLDKITVNGAEISGNTFTMPAAAVTVVVTFKAGETPNPTDDPIVSFADNSEARAKNLYNTVTGGTLIIPTGTKTATDGKLVLTEGVDFTGTWSPEDAPSLYIMLEVSVNGTALTATKNADGKDQYEITVTEDTTVTYKYYVPAKPPVEVIPGSRTAMQTLAVVTPDDETDIPVTYYLLTAEGYTPVVGNASELKNCTEPVLVPADKVPASIQAKCDELSKKPESVLMGWTYVAWSVTFDLGDGTAWPKDCVSTSFSEAKDAAIKAIEAARDAACAPEKGLSVDQQKVVKDIAAGAIKAINGMTEQNSTITMVNNQRDAAIESINAIKADVIDEVIINAPEIDQARGFISLGYHLDKAIDQETMVEMINNNTQGLKVKSVVSFASEKLDETDGTFSTSVPGLPMNHAVVIIPVDGVDSRFEVFLTRYYDIKVDGVHLAWRPAFWTNRGNGTMGSLVTSVTDTNVANNNYLTADVVAAQTAVASANGSGELTRKDGATALTQNKTTTWSWNRPITTYSYSDQNFVTAYSVAAGGMNVTVSKTGVGSVSAELTKSSANGGNVIYAQKGSLVTLLGYAATAEGWYAYKRDGQSVDLDGAQYLKMDVAPTNAYIIDGIEKNAQVEVECGDYMVKVDGEPVWLGAESAFNTAKVASLKSCQFVCPNTTAAWVKVAAPTTNAKGEFSGLTKAMALSENTINLFSAARVSNVDYKGTTGIKTTVKFGSIEEVEWAYDTMEYLAQGTTWTISNIPAGKVIAQSYTVPGATEPVKTILTPVDGKVTVELKVGGYGFVLGNTDDYNTVISTIQLAPNTDVSEVLRWDGLTAINRVNGKNDKKSIADVTVSNVTISYLVSGANKTEGPGGAELLTSQYIKATNGLTLDLTFEAAEDYSFDSALKITSSDPAITVGTPVPNADGTVTVSVGYEMTGSGNSGTGTVPPDDPGLSGDVGGLIPSTPSADKPFEGLGTYMGTFVSGGNPVRTSDMWRPSGDYAVPQYTVSGEVSGWIDSTWFANALKATNGAAVTLPGMGISVTSWSDLVDKINADNGWAVPMTENDRFAIVATQLDGGDYKISIVVPELTVNYGYPKNAGARYVLTYTDITFAAGGRAPDYVPAQTTT